MTLRSRLIITTEDKKMFLVKHKPESTYYALPGGKVEGNESTFECIQREILEELGVTITDPKLLYIVENTPVHSMEFFFHVKTESPSEFLQGKGALAHELAEKVFLDPSLEEVDLRPDFLKNFFEEAPSIEAPVYIFIPS